jgi:hypothetical protein
VNDIPKGIRETKGDEVIYHGIGCRKDLGSDGVQSALASFCLGLSQLACNCRHAENKWPKMLAHPGKKRFWCKRVHIRGHGPDCPFPEIFGDPKAIPVSTSVFAWAIDRRNNGGGSDRPPSGKEPRLLYPAFSAVMGRFTGVAATEAFLASNPDCPPRIQPTSKQFFEEWDRALSEPRFEGGIDARAAAHKEGVEIWAGIVFRAPVTLSKGGCLISGYWWNGTTLVAITLTASEEVAQGAMNALNGIDSVLPPPYFTVAAVEPKGSIRKLCFKGVWTDGTHMVFADSGCERAYVAKVRAAGCILIKLLGFDDIEQLAPVLPPESAGIEWEHLPDYFVWGLDPADPGRMTVVEVCGFEPRKNKEYDDDFDAKQPFYEGTVRGAGLKYHVEKAWLYPRGEEAFQRSSWVNPPITRGWMSRSAQDLVQSELGRQPVHQGTVGGPQGGLPAGGTAGLGRAGELTKLMPSGKTADVTLEPPAQPHPAEKPAPRTAPDGKKTPIVTSRGPILTLPRCTRPQKPSWERWRSPIRHSP